MPRKGAGRSTVCSAPARAAQAEVRARPVTAVSSSLGAKPGWPGAGQPVWAGPGFLGHESEARPLRGCHRPGSGPRPGHVARAWIPRCRRRRRARRCRSARARSRAPVQRDLGPLARQGRLEHLVYGGHRRRWSLAGHGLGPDGVVSASSLTAARIELVRLPTNVALGGPPAPPPRPPACGTSGPCR